MAYADYIHCRECDCKLIPDGMQSARIYLEHNFGDMEADDYTVKLLCPDCLAKVESQIAQLQAERDALITQVNDLCDGTAQLCRELERTRSDLKAELESVIPPACDIDDIMRQPGFDSYSARLRWVQAWNACRNFVLKELGLPIAADDGRDGWDAYANRHNNEGKFNG